MSWFEKHMGGHVSLGPITIHGENAMHWGVSIRTRRWGYVCLRLPFRCFGCWWPLYFYVSPNATPWAATFMLGGDSRHDSARARRRRAAFGHNFDVDAVWPRLRELNDEHPTQWSAA